MPLQPIFLSFFQKGIFEIFIILCAPFVLSIWPHFLKSSGMELFHQEKELFLGAQSIMGHFGNQFLKIQEKLFDLGRVWSRWQWWDPFQCISQGDVIFQFGKELCEGFQNHFHVALFLHHSFHDPFHFRWRCLHQPIQLLDLAAPAHSTQPQPSFKFLQEKFKVWAIKNGKWQGWQLRLHTLPSWTLHGKFKLFDPFMQWGDWSKWWHDCQWRFFAQKPVFQFSQLLLKLLHRSFMLIIMKLCRITKAFYTPWCRWLCWCHCCGLANFSEKEVNWRWR